MRGTLTAAATVLAFCFAMVAAGQTPSVTGMNFQQDGLYGGGVLTCLAIDDAAGGNGPSGLVVAGGDVSGVTISFDGGVTWAPWNDGFTAQSGPREIGIAALNIKDVSATQRDVYAAAYFSVYRRTLTRLSTSAPWVTDGPWVDLDAPSASGPKFKFDPQVDVPFGGFVGNLFTWIGDNLFVGDLGTSDRAGTVHRWSEATETWVSIPFELPEIVAIAAHPEGQDLYVATKEAIYRMGAVNGNVSAVTIAQVMADTSALVDTGFQDLVRIGGRIFVLSSTFGVSEIDPDDDSFSTVWGVTTWDNLTGPRYTSLAGYVDDQDQVVLYLASKGQLYGDLGVSPDTPHASIERLMEDPQTGTWTWTNMTDIVLAPGSTSTTIAGTTNTHYWKLDPAGLRRAPGVVSFVPRHILTRPAAAAGEPKVLVAGAGDAWGLFGAIWQPLVDGFPSTTNGQIGVRGTDGLAVLLNADYGMFYLRNVASAVWTNPKNPPKSSGANAGKSLTFHGEDIYIGSGHGFRNEWGRMHRANDPEANWPQKQLDLVPTAWPAGERTCPRPIGVGVVPPLSGLVKVPFVALQGHGVYHYAQNNNSSHIWTRVPQVRVEATHRIDTAWSAARKEAYLFDIKTGLWRATVTKVGNVGTLTWDAAPLWTPPAVNGNTEMNSGYMVLDEVRGRIYLTAGDIYSYELGLPNSPTMVRSVAPSEGVYGPMAIDAELGVIYIAQKFGHGAVPQLMRWDGASSWLELGTSAYRDLVTTVKGLAVDSNGDLLISTHGVGVVRGVPVISP